MDLVLLNGVSSQVANGLDYQQNGMIDGPLESVGYQPIRLQITVPNSLVW
jgi:hypothetical protein